MAQFALRIGFATSGSLQLLAPGDQLLSRQARKARVQRGVVGGELGAVALGGLGDMRKRLGAAVGDRRDLLAMGLNLRGRVDEGLTATARGGNVDG